tara:strand:- start:167 stop:358 length:192 start_codon:yes stop_codon:yes gene_type:complete
VIIGNGKNKSNTEGLTVRGQRRLHQGELATHLQVVRHKCMRDRNNKKIENQKKKNEATLRERE